jgi:hypothetical protein
MSFRIIYETKGYTRRKVIHNIEHAIEIAKDLPPGKVRIVDVENPTREVWARSEEKSVA